MEPDERSTPLRRFLTATEVAGMLQLTEANIEGLLESGELPGIRVGPDFVWRIEDVVLDSYLEAKYEEARRSALWAGHDFASIAEMDPSRQPRRPIASGPAPHAADDVR